MSESPDGGRSVSPSTYGELRRLAAGQLRRHAGRANLDATSLVHEAWLKCAKVDRGTWESRSHFLAVACRAMRQILVDHARRRMAGKRGGGADPVSIDIARVVGEEDRGVDVLALDDALERMGKSDPRQARVVELRLLAGLQLKEIAELLGVSLTTVEGEWRHAKAWLRHELSD